MQGVFLLEGTHLLEEAKATGQTLEVLCCTEAWQAHHPDLYAWATTAAHRIELVSEEVIKAIATTVSPDGVVATAARMHHEPLNIASLGLVLETIQDPGNLGTMIRTAAAAGVEGLLVSQDSVDLDHPKVLRSSAGQWFRLPMAVSGDLEADLRSYRDRGVQIVATLPTAKLTYWEADFCKPTLILMGNEGAGLSSQLTEIADTPVRIPIAPGVESLNVAIAAALVLFEAQRQRNGLR